MKELHKGILISVEGIDGSGKSTLVKKMQNRLKNNKFPIIATHEPGNTKLGQKLRKILHERDYDLCGKAEFLLFASDRAQHFKDIIIPNLNKKKIIISDRMADSSLAYQGYGRAVDLSMIEKINQWAMQNITPDITFYLEISIKSALNRLKKRKIKSTSFEKETEDFTQKAIIGFDTIFKQRSNIVILDGERSADIIANISYDYLEQWIQNNNLVI